MAQQVFISHSKRDKDLLTELRKVFSSAGIKAYEASFEEQSPPISDTLKTEINNSHALLVLLGPEAQGQAHTMIWIGWEAGIARQQGIPIWVLEDINAQVEMPIPSFTHYLIWDSSDSTQQKKFRDIIEEEIGRGTLLSVESYDAPMLVAQRLGSMLPDKDRNLEVGSAPDVAKDPYEIQCPYDCCGERFLIWSGSKGSLNCPACRQPFDMTAPK